MTGPRLGLVLGLAAVIGFGLGTWLGSTTKPTSAAAVSTPSATPATPSPAAAGSPFVSPKPTETPSANAAPTPEIILSIEGKKHEVTDQFEAKPGWQIQWQIEGDALAVSVSGKPNLGVVINQKGPASGVTGIAEGGEFALNIVATGPWKITVIEGQEPVAS